MCFSIHRIQHVLGSGNFGEVSKGEWQCEEGPVEVAVKTLKSGSSEEEVVRFLQEAAIMGQFRHPNMVQLLGVVTLAERVSGEWVHRYSPSCVTLSLKTFLTLSPLPGHDSAGVPVSRRPGDFPCQQTSNVRQHLRSCYLV